MNRRQWMQQSLASAVALGVCHEHATSGEASPAAELPEATPAKLPRWRGFNLLSMFNVGNAAPFPESDFAWIAELGFNFARLPLDYRCWMRDGSPAKLNVLKLEPIDHAVAFGKKHGVHVQINFHRAPGYTVAEPKESLSVWRDQEALEACTRHWVHFAERYQGRPARELSFNLFNEPDNKVSPEDHRRVVAHLCEAIRKVDPNRLIVCDGRDWGRTAPTELVGLNVAAATRGYEPNGVSHWRASWMPGSDKWPTPQWPLPQGDKTIDRQSLETRMIAPWKAFEAQNVGVMVGEFGAHNQTPHPVVLAWLADFLDLWKKAGWGWALWNLRGSFGILDSDRRDVAYEDFHGHKLDRQLLSLLLAN